MCNYIDEGVGPVFLPNGRHQQRQSCLERAHSLRLPYQKGKGNERTTAMKKANAPLRGLPYMTSTKCLDFLTPESAWPVPWPVRKMYVRRFGASFSLPPLSLWGRHIWKPPFAKRNMKRERLTDGLIRSKVEVDRRTSRRLSLQINDTNSTTDKRQKVKGSKGQREIERGRLAYSPVHFWRNLFIH